MPQMPESMRERFIEAYSAIYADAAEITHDRNLAEYFETTARITANPKLSANWILGELTRELNNSGASAADSPVTAEDLAELLNTIEAGKINNSQGKEVLVEMFKTGGTAPEVISAK